jgi:hypothetical protein
MASLSMACFGVYNCKKCLSVVSLDISTSVTSLPNVCLKDAYMYPHLQSKFQYYPLLLIVFKNGHPYPHLQSHCQFYLLVLIAFKDAYRILAFNPIFNDITWKLLFWWMLLFIINFNFGFSTISRRYRFSNCPSLVSLMISVSFAQIGEKCF